MRTNIQLLDRVDIAAPCHADWDKMEGDDRARHCQECRLNVYNLSDMTRKEAEELVQKYEGQRLCVRFFRRKDGTILTDNCPVGIRRLRNLAIAKWAALASAASALLWIPIAKAMSFVSSNESTPSVENRQEIGDPTPIPAPPVSINLPIAGGMSIRPTPQIPFSNQGFQGKIASPEVKGEISAQSNPSLGSIHVRSANVKEEFGDVSVSRKQ